MRVLFSVAGPREAGRAVRAAVPRLFSLGTHEFRRLKQQGGILVNGEAAHADRILREGDEIQLCLRDEGGAKDPPLPLEDRGCRVVYLDSDLLVVCKAAPLPTLPSAHPRGDTLREVLRDLLGAPDEAFRYHPVNRLDRGTSGLLVIARHAHAQRLLSRQLHTREFAREYLAVTEGIPDPPEGLIDAPIAKPASGVKRFVGEGGQSARTRFCVLKTHGNRALLRLRLETGRTHQIRVHLSYLSCPIVGDFLYGQAHPLLPDRFALHSAALSLTHPITGARLSFKAPPPEVFLALLEEE